MHKPIQTFVIDDFGSSEIPCSTTTDGFIDCSSLCDWSECSGITMQTLEYEDFRSSSSMLLDCYITDDNKHDYFVNQTNSRDPNRMSQAPRLPTRRGSALQLPQRRGSILLEISAPHCPQRRGSLFVVEVPAPLLAHRRGSMLVEVKAPECPQRRGSMFLVEIKAPTCPQRRGSVVFEISSQQTTDTDKETNTTEPEWSIRQVNPDVNDETCPIKTDKECAQRRGSMFLLDVKAPACPQRRGSIVFEISSQQTTDTGKESNTTEPEWSIRQVTPDVKYETSPMKMDKCKYSSKISQRRGSLILIGRRSSSSTAKTEDETVADTTAPSVDETVVANTLAPTAA